MVNEGDLGSVLVGVDPNPIYDTGFYYLISAFFDEHTQYCSCVSLTGSKGSLLPEA